jgi:hypothetical protein
LVLLTLVQLHQQLVGCAWAYFKGYIRSVCSVCGHVAMVTSTLGAAYMHQQLVQHALPCYKGYINSWCSVHGHVARVTSTFGAACAGMLQGLHQVIPKLEILVTGHGHSHSKKCK